MARLVIYTLMSLNGAVDAPDRYFPETGDRPGAPVFDRELAEFESEMISRQRAVLLGRRSHDEWARYWPTSDEQPFADFMNAAPKFVLTSSPLASSWSHAEPIAGPLDRAVNELKTRVDGDIGVHASITVAQSLLEARLADELCLAVGRVIDPQGRRLFDSITELQELTLIQAAATSSGSLWLRYQLPT